MGMVFCMQLPAVYMLMELVPCIVMHCGVLGDSVTKPRGPQQSLELGV